jgi:putative SOS response-associated peptidase YedK
MMLADLCREVIRSFAIITTIANAAARPVHDRTPVVLEPDNWPL